VLMDVQMPQMDGLEAVRRIRRLQGGARLPVIALTAGVLADEHQQAIAAGMDEIETKPLDIARLIAAIVRRTRGAHDAQGMQGTLIDAAETAA